ncbi:DMT family transporter [Thermosynechococcaceae cyanobacterium BACA0444]|uniref:DMT family transporter n=1 Tax=Pseudocalidococcus azoricus BACA0444 TaxID=2918990 RepID=A0AAE4JVT1_9CYAN|nr:DMT family transporter [Pseudocalidococcus azoricus]MDS3859393.1 DMT family transporter [Pseudocalidococcus azoricus BACA0444]
MNQDFWLGQLAALSSAALWAAASVGYRYLGQTIPALGLNLAKGLVALGLILLTVLGLPIFPIQESPQAVGLLLVSGFLGIGLGDTAYFVALRELGARITLLLCTLSPLITLLLAFCFLNETIPHFTVIGTIITLGGITIVISERTPSNSTPTAPSAQLSKLGLIAVMGSNLAQAGGVILARMAFLDTEFDPLYAALLRIFAGVLFLVILGGSQGKLGAWLEGFWQLKGGARRGNDPAANMPSYALNLQACMILVLAALAGTYLGIWLQQISLKFVSAGIAQTLSSTSPLFILLLAPILKEPITIRAGLGAILAVGGIALVFLNPTL